MKILRCGFTPELLTVFISTSHKEKFHILMEFVILSFTCFVIVFSQGKFNFYCYSFCLINSMIKESDQIEVFLNFQQYKVDKCDNYFFPYISFVKFGGISYSIFQLIIYIKRTHRHDKYKKIKQNLKRKKCQICQICEIRQYCVITGKHE